jgi:hypothetical protein
MSYATHCIPYDETCNLCNPPAARGGDQCPEDPNCTGCDSCVRCDRCAEIVNDDVVTSNIGLFCSEECALAARRAFNEREPL